MELIRTREIVTRTVELIRTKVEYFYRFIGSLYEKAIYIKNLIVY